jgi:aspartyl/asparaginyl beta-hydroxylase (cupin superfamily)
LEYTAREVPSMIGGFRLNWARAKNVVTRPFYSASRLFFHVAGGKKRPVFFDIDETSPSLRALDEQWKVIRDEVLSILPEKHRIPSYYEIDRVQSRISAPTDKGATWKVFMLEAMGAKPEANRAKCPRTCALLDRIPNLYAAFFSILDPGKSVPAHDGPYCGYLRYHLGLIVPETKPPTMRVKDRYHTWREGESLLFDDSWNHEVVNESDGIRVILIVDIFRPMPFPVQWLNRYITYRYLRKTYADPVLQKAAQHAART